MNTAFPVRQPRLSRILLGLVIMGFWVTGCRQEVIDKTKSAYSNWSAYAGSSDGAQFSALDQVNVSNVQQLQVAWSYATGDNNRYFFAPLVVGDRAYVLAKDHSIVAINATTGIELWAYKPEGSGRAMTTRGINFWESSDGREQRLFFSSDHHLRALNARTGKLADDFGTSGSVNLKEGLGRDPESLSLVQSHSPGRVFEDLLILGSATNEGYGSAPGDVRAFDVRTGKLVWTFHTIPHPGEFGYDTWPTEAWKTVGGANVWTEFALDEKRGIVYLPIASAKYNFYGADREGANLFSNCLVALDARSGRRLWHFQFVHHDIWDYDPATSPKLLTIDRDGEAIDVVAQATKQGFLFVFDRVTGEPIWPIEERKVPMGTELPGETLWATQPFPIAPAPFARQSFTADDLNPYLREEETVALRTQLENARNEGLFTPPSFRETIQMPGNNGGSNWGGGAVDPQSGRLYIVSKDHPAILKLEPDPSQVAPPPQDSVSRGRYFYDTYCYACHSVATDDNPLAVLPLVGVSDRLSDEQILNVIRQGQGPMPGFASIADPDAQLLLEFLKDPAAFPRMIGGEGKQLDGNARFTSGFGLVRTRDGLPIISPPWTTLTAYDLNRGEIEWQRPIGDVPELAAKGIRNTGSAFQKMGPVVTAGGLIFVGCRDGFVRALDLRDGSTVWEAEVGVALEGIPAVYESGGRQYILFCASAQKGLTRETEVTIEGRYVAFALPEK